MLKGEEPHFCVSSDEPLSLEAILLSCSDLIDIRQKLYFNVNSLKVLFNDVSSDIVFNFLKEINIFYKLFFDKKYTLFLILIEMLDCMNERGSFDMAFLI